MVPAPRQTAEDAGRAVLDAADQLFYRKGVAGVGMDDVRDAAGVSLRRLYQLHPTKRDLVAAWLRDRHLRWTTWFTSAVEAGVARGRPAEQAALDAVEEWAATPGFRGCAFVNTAAEAAAIDAEHREIIAGHKRQLVDDLTAVLIRTRPDAPAWVAQAVAVLVDGAVVQAAVLGSTEPVRAARLAAARLLPPPPWQP